MRYASLIFATIVFSIGLFQSASAQTPPASCYCIEINMATRKYVASCSAKANCTADEACQQLDTAAACDTKVREFNAAQQGNTTVGPTTNNNGGLVSKIIKRPCVLADNFDPNTECGDVTIFLYLMFDIINYLFSIIGGVALLFFVYGGFVFILSEGNAEKVAHGKSIIVASVLGIIIAFSGYALVRFVGTVIGLKSEYQLIE